MADQPLCKKTIGVSCQLFRGTFTGEQNFQVLQPLDEMQMLGGRSGGASASGGEASYGGSMPSAPAPSRSGAPGKKVPSFEDMDDDIPF